VALTFIDLTNRTLRRFGGKEAAAASFDTSTDPEIRLAKDAVNDAILDINMYEFEWAFNVTATTLTMVAGTQRYTLPSDTKDVDMDTIMLNQSDALSVNQRWLPQIDYDHWVKNFSQRDGDATSSDYDTPSHVFRYPNNNLGFTKIPDQAYTVSYTRYVDPTTLSVSTDTTRIPDRYGQVIVNGACYYLNAKRGNSDQASMFRQEFAKGVSRMRTIETNDQYVRVKDRRMKRRRGSAAYIGNVTLT